MTAVPMVAAGVVEAAVRVGGLAVLAGSVTAAVSLVFRVRTRNRFPDGATLIVGLGVVALVLNTRLVLIRFIGEGYALIFSEAVVNMLVFVVAGVASYGGRHVGDQVGRSDRIEWSRVTPGLSPIVRATGRVITLTLPAEIEDVSGYDPVPEETKQALAGRTMDFAKGLTVAELEAGLAERLRDEFGIGFVDAEVTADADVEYLAVGKRLAGIGPTIPPNMAVVAVRGDPAFSASPGDTVELWDPNDGPGRVGTGELRASVKEVATVAVEEAVAERIVPDREYRLVTVPAAASPDREFAGLLRRSDETIMVVEVTAESPLAGSTVGAVGGNVIAIEAAGSVDTIPVRDLVIAAGDRLFVIGRPDALRKLDPTGDAAGKTQDQDRDRDRRPGRRGR